MFVVERVYKAPDPSDGRRILVDRLWPRGLKKESAQIDDWLKELAPSDALRRWFDHRPERWVEFQAKYRAELASPAVSESLKRLRALGRKGAVTLLYAARDEIENNAQVLKRVLTKSAK